MEAVTKSAKVKYLEELLELLPKLPTTSRTKLWSNLPSEKVGEFIDGIPYTGAITLQKRIGPDAVEKLREYAKHNDWADVDNYRSRLLYPEGVKNLRRILDREHCECKLTRDELRVWSKIKSGRDLFIAGLGAFNIREVVRQIEDRAVDTFRYHYNDSAYSVASIQAMGYFDDNTDNKGMVTHKAILAHIKVHWPAWREFGYGHFRDVACALDNYMTPDVESGKYLQYTPEKLYEKARISNNRMTEDNLRAHKAELTGPFKVPLLPVTNLEFTLIKTAEDLVAVGEHFENCIGSRHYIGRGVIGSSCYIVIEEKGEPYVADICVVSGKIEQLKGKNNATAPMCVRVKMNDLARNIAKLARAKN